MPAAPARRSTPAAGGRAQRAGRTSRAGGRSANARAQPLEQRMLLTATLCLLAFGAVMVYSASSATSLLQGSGTGSSYLVRYLVYGAIGLVAMRVLARNGMAIATRYTGPLLAISIVLVLAVHVPHLGVSVNGARRWLGAGPLQFEPSEILKLALVLYSATLLAKRPQQVHDMGKLRRPLLYVIAGASLLVAVEPDIGSAMVIGFVAVAMLVAAGIARRNLVIIIGCALGAVALYALARPYARARLTSFLNPWAHASGSG